MLGISEGKAFAGWQTRLVLISSTSARQKKYTSHAVFRGVIQMLMRDVSGSELIVCTGESIMCVTLASVRKRRDGGRAFHFPFAFCGIIMTMSQAPLAPATDVARCFLITRCALLSCQVASGCAQASVTSNDEPASPLA